MKKSSKASAKSGGAIPQRTTIIDFDEATFAEISKLISDSRARALLSVNTVLIDLYWNIGGIISRKIAATEWEDGVVAQLAGYIARTQPSLRGFTRSNLFRMRQFYETYREDEKSHRWCDNCRGPTNLIILGQSKRPEMPPPSAICRTRSEMLIGTSSLVIECIGDSPLIGLGARLSICPGCRYCVQADWIRQHWPTARE